jgi:hypothetical protein
MFFLTPFIVVGTYRNSLQVLSFSHIRFRVDSVEINQVLMVLSKMSTHH